MIYEIPKHNIAIDLSRLAAISWKESVPAKKVPWWKFFLSLGWDCPSPEERSCVRISPEKWYAADYEYDTDKEAKKVYADLVKAWKGK